MRTTRSVCREREGEVQTRTFNHSQQQRSSSSSSSSSSSRGAHDTIAAAALARGHKCEQFFWRPRNKKSSSTPACASARPTSHVSLASDERFECVCESEERVFSGLISVQLCKRLGGRHHPSLTPPFKIDLIRKISSSVSILF